MTFNAKWELEELCNEKGLSISYLLSNFLTDVEKMIGKLPVYELRLKNNQTAFDMFDANGSFVNTNNVYEKHGLYTIFSRSHVVYVGETDNLKRRQFKDVDGLADSGKRFKGQDKAILKYLMKEKTEKNFSLSPLFIQMYPGDYKLGERAATFGDFYKLGNDSYRKCLEGFLRLIVGSYHNLLIARTKSCNYHNT